MSFSLFQQPYDMDIILILLRLRQLNNLLKVTASKWHNQDLTLVSTNTKQEELMMLKMKDKELTFLELTLIPDNLSQ